MFDESKIKKGLIDQLFDVKYPDRTKEFLNSRSDILDLLPTVAKEIPKYFGDVKCVLEVWSDGTVYVLIPIDMSVKDARVCLAAFDEGWWLDRPTALEDICVDVDFV